MVHVHPEEVGGFIPAAPQSKDAVLATGAGVGAGAGAEVAAPGLGASHIVHLAVAPAGFERPHIPHVQSPPTLAVGAFIPAAPQSNDEVFATGAGAGAGAGAEALGLGASQIVHFSVALAGLDKLHVPHVHCAPLPDEGAFIPAAAQSNDAALATGAGVNAVPNVNVGSFVTGISEAARASGVSGALKDGTEAVNEKMGSDEIGAR